MTRQQGLLAQWRRRLADCESRLALWGASETQMRGVWLQRMYARVLRYLIQRYERPEEADSFLEPFPPADPEHLSAADARLRYREYVPIGHGSPPKSATRIRATLDAVHEVNAPQHLVGPMTAGLSPDDWILAARCRRRWHVPLLRRELSLAGTPSRPGRYFAHEVWVRRRDLERAMRVAECFLRRHRTSFVDPTFWIVWLITTLVCVIAMLLVGLLIVSQ